MRYVTESNRVVSLPVDVGAIRINDEAAVRKDLLGNTFRTPLALLRMLAPAEDLMVRVCSGCQSVLGVKTGLGVTGLSHGICPPCLTRIYPGHIPFGEDNA